MSAEHDLARAELCGAAQACADFMERNPDTSFAYAAARELIQAVARYRAKMSELYEGKHD